MIFFDLTWEKETALLTTQLTKAKNSNNVLKVKLHGGQTNTYLSGIFKYITLIFILAFDSTKK